MGLEVMSNLFSIFFKYKLVISALLITLIITTAGWLYKDATRFSLTAKFTETTPLKKRIPVFCKGYKIGEIKEIKLSDDYKFSLVKIILYPRSPKLSKDVVAKVRHHDVIKDYIELSNPDEASTTLLKSGEVIDGEAGFDMESFLADIENANIIVPLLQNFSDTLVSIKTTSNGIGKFFADSRSILKDNKQNLNDTTKYLVQSTKSLKKLTSRLNNSITDDKINNTTTNVDKSSANILDASENIKRITQNVDCATKNLDQTIAKIDCTIADTKVITSNVKTITCGFREVLGKRLAGIRIIFGKPVKNNSCCKNCN